MIRLLIAGLMVLMAGNANAFTNEHLYKFCKSYADNGFELNDEGLACRTYFVGVYDGANSVCLIAEEVRNPKNKNEGFDVLVEMLGVGKGGASYDAVIQHYLNRMRNEPQSWDQNAQWFVVQSLQSFSPCSPE